MLKRYFVTGLLLWGPLVITVWVLNLIVGTMDQSLALLPAKWQPQVWLGRDIPGVGVVLTVLIVFVTGLLTTNFIGRALVQLGEWILSRIPVVRTLYSSIKQVSDTILSPHGQAFRKALLVEYPRRGCWTLGFLTGAPSAAMQAKMGVSSGQEEDTMVSVFVPTTPTPGMSCPSQTCGRHWAGSSARLLSSVPTMRPSTQTVITSGTHSSRPVTK